MLHAKITEIIILYYKIMYYQKYVPEVWLTFDVLHIQNQNRDTGRFKNLRLGPILISILNMFHLSRVLVNRRI